MGTIKKIQEKNLIGGTSAEDVYPITSIKAVYDDNNEKLDSILKRRSGINISTNYNNSHTAEILSLEEAINKVPIEDRVVGFHGFYLSKLGWESIYFLGEDLENHWVDINYWANIPNEVFKSLNKNMLFVGVATPTTNPGTPNSLVFYIANTAGEYKYFSTPNNPITLDNGLYILCYDFGSDSWTAKNILQVAQDTGNDSSIPISQKAVTRSLNQQSTALAVEITKEENRAKTAESSLKTLIDNVASQKEFSEITISNSQPLEITENYPLKGIYKVITNLYNNDFGTGLLVVSDTPTDGSVGTFQSYIFIGFGELGTGLQENMILPSKSWHIINNGEYIDKVGETNSDLALGETETTAYRGDRGASMYSFLSEVLGDTNSPTLIDWLNNNFNGEDITQLSKQVSTNTNNIASLTLATNKLSTTANELSADIINIDNRLDSLSVSGNILSEVEKKQWGIYEIAGKTGVLNLPLYQKMFKFEYTLSTENSGINIFTDIKEFENNPIIYFNSKDSVIEANPLGFNSAFDSLKSEELFSTSWSMVNSKPALTVTPSEVSIIDNTNKYIVESDIKYSGSPFDIKTISITYNSAEDAQNAQLTIPKLKFNKEALFSLCDDDSHGQAYSVLFAACNNRKIALTAPYNSEQLQAEDYPNNVLEPLGHTLCFTDGCGNERRFRLESAIWTYGNYLNDEGAVDKGNSENNYRFHYYMCWDDLKEMTEYGHGIAIHDVDVQYTSTPQTISEGLDKSISDSLINLGRGVKLITEPSGDNNYNLAMNYNNHILMSLAQGNGTTVYPTMSDYFNIYHLVPSRDFPDDATTYEATITSIMNSTSLPKKWMFIGCHTASQSHIDLLEWIYQNYGRVGTDNIWVTNRDEVYEYTLMRNNCFINKSVNGNIATFEIGVIKGEYFYFPELTFISNISFSSLDSGNINGVSINDTKTMFNLNFADNLLDLAEKYTAKTETNSYIVGTTVYTKSEERVAREKADAIYFVSMLRPDLQTSFLNRINIESTSVPTLNSIILNNGATITNSATINVALNVTGNYTHYQLNSSGVFTDSNWVEKTNTITYKLNELILAGQTVFAIVKNENGSSNVKSSTIILELTTSSITVTVTATANDNLMGSISPINSYVQIGDSVTVTATANTGYVIDSWEGVDSFTGVGTTQGTGTINSVSMAKNTIKVNFKLIPTISSTDKTDIVTAPEETL